MNIIIKVCLKLDDLLDQHLIQIPDYIKIDVDGHEMEVLKGMEKVLKIKN